MNNTERIKNRIARDKQRKACKREALHRECDDLDKVFTFQHFLEAFKKCKRGVSWKASVQLYENRCIEEIHYAYKITHEGNIPRLKNTKPITIRERGKKRIITPVRINDRMIQRVLCDYALIPIMSPTLIYDNCASLQEKGIDFARKRVEKQLRRAMREYGNDFYILEFDVKSFFDSIPHKLCRKVLDKYFTDKRIVDITMKIIHSYQIQEAERIKDKAKREALIRSIENDEGVGICLGSQVSQVMALCVISNIDHFVKDKIGAKYYIRYMDDGNMISNDKDFLWQVKEEMDKMIEQSEMKLHPRKTKIVKASKGFVFLKVRYKVQNGKLVKILTKGSAMRMRRKLKKLRPKVDKGILSYDDIYTSMQSWLGHSKYGKSYKSRKRMLELYDELYGGYRITEKWKKEEQAKYEILQSNIRQQYSWGCDNKWIKEISEET